MGEAEPPSGPGTATLAGDVSTLVEMAPNARSRAEGPAPNPVKPHVATVPSNWAGDHQLAGDGVVLVVLVVVEVQ